MNITSLVVCGSFPKGSRGSLESNVINSSIYLPISSRDQFPTNAFPRLDQKCHHPLPLCFIAYNPSSTPPPNFANCCVLCSDVEFSQHHFRHGMSPSLSLVHHHPLNDDVPLPKRSHYSRGVGRQSMTSSSR